MNNQKIKINTFLFIFLSGLLITSLILISISFFRFYLLKSGSRKVVSSELNTKEKHALLENDYLVLVPVNLESQEEILKKYKILEIGKLYEERGKIFINLSQKSLCPQIREIIFLPFYAQLSETKQIFISLIHCNEKFARKIQGEVKIKEKRYLISFEKIREGSNFSLWRGQIPKFSDIKEIERNFYPIVFLIEDNFGNTIEFNYFIEIF